MLLTLCCGECWQLCFSRYAVESAGTYASHVMLVEPGCLLMAFTYIFNFPIKPKLYNDFTA
jgi:hypothetical protein